MITMKPNFTLTAYFKENPVTHPDDFVAVAVKYDATIVGPIREIEGLVGVERQYAATARLVHPKTLNEICAFTIDMGKVHGVDALVGVSSESLRINASRGLLQIVVDYRR